MKFNECNISNQILNAINDMGFEDMMPIQEQSIPVIIEGKDVLGQAQTGTGKTAAFSIPTIQKINIENQSIQALVIAPTRELAFQILDEIKKLSKYKRIRTAIVCGGMNYNTQLADIKKNPHIVVGTPGRLIDLLSRNKLKLGSLETFIIDEVDEMFKAGFKEEVDQILGFLPKEKQSLLFSATITKDVKRIADQLLNKPQLISVSSGLASTKSVAQYFIQVTEKNKYEALTNLIDVDKPERAIIFGRTKKRVDELTDALALNEYNALGIHGDMPQSQRLSVMKRFRNGTCNILVATDVAARGLDINGITHVYNFDLPQEVEFYVHRIGRTGRANTTGTSISFVRKAEMSHLDKIIKMTSSEINRMEIPTKKQVRQEKLNLLKSEISDTIENKNLKRTYNLALELMEEHSPEYIVAALLEKSIDKLENVPVELTGEPPVRVKKQQHNHSSSRGKGNYRGDRNRNKSRRSGGGNKRNKKSNSSNRQDNYRKNK